MPNLAVALKEEIQRLARKELRAQTAALKKASSQHRREIAELKRQVAQLQRRVAYLEKQEKKRVQSPGSASNGQTIRFSPSWLKSHREKLGLSAADYADLVGVSGLTIYNWEKGRTKPQQKQLEALGEVRGLGKREAWRRLELMEE